jgi:hypothetical protein
MNLQGLVRTTDPQPSHDAAERISKRRRTVQRRVLLLLRERGEMTDGQLVEAYREVYGTTPESTPRKRRTELTDMGVVVDTGRHTPRHMAVVPDKTDSTKGHVGDALFRVIWDLNTRYKTQEGWAMLTASWEDEDYGR